MGWWSLFSPVPWTGAGCDQQNRLPYPLKQEDQNKIVFPHYVIFHWLITMIVSLTIVLVQVISICGQFTNFVDLHKFQVIESQRRPGTEKWIYLFAQSKFYFNLCNYQLCILIGMNRLRIWVRCYFMALSVWPKLGLRFWRLQAETGRPNIVVLHFFIGWLQW